MRARWRSVGIGFGAAGARFLSTGRAVFEARALGVQGLLNGGALTYLLFASSSSPGSTRPRYRVRGSTSAAGPGARRSPADAVSWLCRVLLCLALAAAGLIEGRIDRVWAKTARLWALAAFVPLTLGIALGSYWAYYELGWGGWWSGSGRECEPHALAHRRGADALVIVTEKRGSSASGPPCWPCWPSLRCSARLCARAS